MQCIICNTKLNSFSDTQEVWQDGLRLIICKKEKCKKIYSQKMKQNLNKKNC